jgi:hypothetical protein
MMLSTRVVQVRPESVNTCSQNSDHLGHRFAAWIAGYDDKPRLSYRRGIQWALAAYRQALGGFEQPSLGPEADGRAKPSVDPCVGLSLLERVFGSEEPNHPKFEE